MPKHSHVNQETRKRLIAAALATTTLAGCGSALTSTDTARKVKQAPDAAPEPKETVDATGKDALARKQDSGVGDMRDDDDVVMCELERRFPGFAGAVQDPERDVLSLLFAEGSSVPDPHEVKDALSELGFAVEGRAVVHRVDHAFCTLKRWYDRLMKRVFRLEGVVMIDIDERRNRLVVGVLDKERWAAAVEAAARRTRVPPDVILVEEVEPFDVL